MKRSCWLFALWIAFALCGPTGCSSFRTQMGKPLTDESKKFAENQTRVDAVLHELGPPHQVSRLPDGFVFLYEYSLINEFQLGFSMNLPVVRWLKFLKAWNYLEQQALELSFDEKGVLRGAGSRNW